MGTPSQPNSTMETADHARVAGYVCVGLSLFILVGRLILCRWQHKPFDLSSYLVILSILTITARTITNQVSLKLGTANDALIDEDHGHYFDPDNARNIKVGSILSLLSRVLLTATLWFQVSILLLFYSNITSGIRLVATTMKVTWIALIASFASIVLATFLECHPFSLYWQVEPKPGQCIKAYVQLVLQGVSNVVLDCMLLFIAYPLVTLRQQSWAKQLSLYTLFTLGTFCIIITIVRLVLVFQQDSSQISRSLWASVQITVSIFVANAPTIYGTIRTARRKGSQQPITPTQANSETIRRPSRPREQSWLKMDDDISLMPVPLGLPRSPPAVVIFDEETGMATHNPTPPLTSRDHPHSRAKSPNSVTDVH